MKKREKNRFGSLCLGLDTFRNRFAPGVDGCVASDLPAMALQRRHHERSYGAAQCTRCQALGGATRDSDWKVGTGVDLQCNPCFFGVGVLT